MIKRAKHVAAPEAPVVETPEVTTAPTAPKAKPVRYVKGRFADNMVIRLKVQGNPKRASGKSAGRFALYRDGMTVAEYVQACVDAQWKSAKAHDDVRWDVAHGFIAVVEA